MGHGTDLQNISKALQGSGIDFELYGLDTYRPSLEEAAQKNINAKFCNIEKDTFPFPDQYFDLIVANQVIEHTKEIFWIYSEVSRLLKPGGAMITGVPNIASFHNRIGMLFGVQPTNIELLGPRVRGFTAGSFKKFIETDGYFKNIELKGGNFYPFTKPIANFLAWLFPKAAVSIFMLTERTVKPGAFHDILNTRFFETPYYRGPNAKSL